MSRLLFIAQGYSTHTRRFLAGLAGAGHEVWFQPCEKGGDELEMHPFPASVQCVPSLRLDETSADATQCLAATGRLRRIVDKAAPDLILAGPVQTGGFVAALAGFHPLAVMSWGYDVLSVPQRSEWLRSITKFTLSRADMVIGDCNAVRGAVCKFGSVPRDRIVCFPWGIDLDLFRPGAPPGGLRERLGWHDCQIIVSARSLEPFHGTMTFLDLMRRVVEQRSSARVLMLGDGSLRSRVESFIAEHDLEEKLYVAGRVPEELLPGYFAEADVYISATHCDGSSVSLLEAMGCGLPAIVPDVGGNKEWVTHGQNGWIYPLGSVNALVAATTQALDDDERRRGMGFVNTRIVRERADWQRNLSILLDVCKRLTAVDFSPSIPSYAEL